MQQKGGWHGPFFSFQITANDCLIVSIYHARSLVFNLNQVLFHFSQAVPGYIVRIHVECALKSPRPVLKEHDVKCLFDRGNGIIKSKQVRIGGFAISPERKSLTMFGVTSCDR